MFEVECQYVWRDGIENIYWNIALVSLPFSFVIGVKRGFCKPSQELLLSVAATIFPLLTRVNEFVPRLVQIAIANKKRTGFLA